MKKVITLSKKKIVVLIAVIVIFIGFSLTAAASVDLAEVFQQYQNGEPITNTAPAQYSKASSLPGIIRSLTGIFLLIPILLGFLLLSIMGLVTMRLAHHKGYSGYFWTGFFLQIVGLIYVVGLPERNRRQY